MIGDSRPGLPTRLWQRHSTLRPVSRQRPEGDIEQERLTETVITGKDVEPIGKVGTKRVGGTNVLEFQ